MFDIPWLYKDTEENATIVKASTILNESVTDAMYRSILLQFYCHKLF